MKLSAEQIRDIAALRERLRERLGRLHEEMEETNLNIAALDAALTRSSFTKASEYTPQDDGKPADSAAAGATADAKTPPPADAPVEAAAEDPVRTAGPVPQVIAASKGDTTIGSLYRYPDRMVIVMDEDVSISTETDPFKTFFLDRVMDEMRRKDAADVDAGRITADLAISCEVEAPGGRIDRITITNYRTDERAREIDSTARWVLNRMLENVG